MSPNQTPVAVLGLGAMGIALAHCLLQAKYSVKAWNRTQGRPSITALVDAGADLKLVPQDAVQGCKLVIICVLDYSSVYDILKQVRPVPEDNVIINLTNGTSNDALRMNTHIQNKTASVAYFDGAIMTTPQLVGTEQSFLFISGGSKELYMRNRGPGNEIHSVEKVLGSFGRVNYIGTSPGAASLYDLALLAGLYGMFSGAMTATGLLSRCDKNDLPRPSTDYPRSAIATVMVDNMIPMLRALLPTVAKIAASVETNDYGAHGHTNKMQLAGLRNIVQACSEEKVDAGGLSHLLKIFEETVKEGGDQNGIGLVAQRFLLD